MAEAPDSHQQVLSAFSHFEPYRRRDLPQEALTVCAGHCDTDARLPFRMSRPGNKNRRGTRRQESCDTRFADHGYAVASILPFVRKSDAVFDDRVTALLGEAFDAACRELHDKGQPSIVYELIATKIIEAAKKGERDLEKLRDAGLSSLGLKNNAASGQKRFS
jgi:hypothetical protein